jgi:hypothetical protein
MLICFTKLHNPLHALPLPPAPRVQVTDAFIDRWIELTADRLPPVLGPPTMALFEMIGGRMKQSDSPVGFAAGEVSKSFPCPFFPSMVQICEPQEACWRWLQ